MTFGELRSSFERLKTSRRTTPDAVLSAIGSFGAESLALLATETDLHDVLWHGQGTKQYAVAVERFGPSVHFSRPINMNSLLTPSDFHDGWRELLSTLDQSRGSNILSGIHEDLVNDLLYSAVIGFAACVDLFQPRDRGGPGSFFEMVIGPIVSILTSREERSAVSIPVPETGDFELIPVDLSFEAAESDVVLVIPSKISTRERISQAYVHQLILDRSIEFTGKIFRSALAVVNETNLMFPKGTMPEDRVPSSAYVQETLVPGTIILYQKYVSQLSGLYYLDPPNRYQVDTPVGFPRVRLLAQLFTEDLPSLLED